MTKFWGTYPITDVGFGAWEVTDNLGVSVPFDDEETARWVTYRLNELGIRDGKCLPVNVKISTDMKAALVNWLIDTK